MNKSTENSVLQNIEVLKKVSQFLFQYGRTAMSSKAFHDFVTSDGNVFQNLRKARVISVTHGRSATVTVIMDTNKDLRYYAELMTKKGSENNSVARTASLAKHQAVIAEVCAKNARLAEENERLKKLLKDNNINY